MINLAEEPKALESVSTPLIGPMIRKRGTEKTCQISMGTVDEDTIQSSLSDPGSRSAKGIDDLLDL
jgi:hypothetical protein